MRPIVCMRGLKSGAHFPDRLYIPANSMLPWKRKEKIQNHRVCRGLLRMIFHFPGILFPYKYLPVNNGISWVPRPFCRLHFIPAEQYCHPDIFQKINFPPFLLPETCVPRVRAENVTADTPFAAGANHFFPALSERGALSPEVRFPQGLSMILPETFAKYRKVLKNGHPDE